MNPPYWQYGLNKPQSRIDLRTPVRSSARQSACAWPRIQPDQAAALALGFLEIDPFMSLLAACRT